MAGGAREALDAVFRQESGLVIAALIAEFRNFDLAEEAFQDAVASAMEAWPSRGLPRNCGAWLTTVAKRRAIDRIRRGQTHADKLDEAAVMADEEDARGAPRDELSAVPDHRLELIFTCCHPALAQTSQVALTLRTLGGLTTEEIARAFLTSERTLAQRLVRAKRKIRDAGIPYEIPGRADRSERLDSVTHVVYLIFNEGYSAGPRGSAARNQLRVEAIRLARVLAYLLGGEAEVLGLLALPLLQDSRNDARIGEDGALVPLDEQDRTLWNRAAVDEGLGLVRKFSELARPGPLQTEAAIAAVHAESLYSRRTDWQALVTLYAALEQMKPTPVVRANLAAAVGMVEGPRAGLALLDEAGLADALQDYQPYHAARADLLRRAGDTDAARDAYGQALALSADSAERKFLEARRAGLRLLQRRGGEGPGPLAPNKEDADDSDNRDA